MFLKNLQNSEENTRARVSFLIKLLKKGIWHSCFPVNFAKFLRTLFLTEDLRWLLLLFLVYLFNYDSSKSTLFMLNMAFDVLLSTVFVKYIRILRFLFFVSFTCNINKNNLLFALCFHMCFFVKTLLFSIMVILIFHSILTSVSNSDFQQ